MKVINFIGCYNKTEIMLYVAKIVKSMGNSVLYIDSVVTQKCRYIIPAIEYTEKYVTTFEEIDIAIGFASKKEIVDYLNENGEDFNNYDYIFLDIDSEDMIKDFDVVNANSNICIISYDKQDIMKTVLLIEEILNNSKDYVGKVKINRVDMATFIGTADVKYIDYNFKDLYVDWNKKIITMPLDEGDKTVIIQNQYSEKMKFKELTKTFKNGLIDISQIVLEEKNNAEITRVFKNIERRV